MIRNVVFDLGGVVLSRNRAACPENTNRFFAFLRETGFPACWVDYDRGVISQQEVAAALALRNGGTQEQAMRHIEVACSSFAVFPETEQLIRELAATGNYRLFVLSNMPERFYDYIRKFGIFRFFEGVVISCQEHLVKPETAFYQLLCDRYGLLPEESLFIDDRIANISAAAALGFQTCHFPDVTEGCEQVRQILQKAAVA